MLYGIYLNCILPSETFSSLCVYRIRLYHYLRIWGVCRPRFPLLSFTALRSVCTSRVKESYTACPIYDARLSLGFNSNQCLACENPTQQGLQTLFSSLQPSPNVRPAFRTVPFLPASKQASIPPSPFPSLSLMLYLPKTSNFSITSRGTFLHLPCRCRQHRHISHTQISRSRSRSLRIMVRRIVTQTNPVLHFSTPLYLTYMVICV